VSILPGRISSLPGSDLGSDFWWIFASSTCLCLVGGASAPLLARYALDDLGASPSVVGLVVGSSSIAAIALRPLLGALADRFGLRRISVIGSVTLALGVIVLMLARSVGPGTAGRMISGLSTAAANTALMAWVIGLVPLEQRGRALGIFGVSIWVGLAAGPQIGQTLVSLGGYSALWIGCGVLGLASAGCVLRARPPRIETRAPGPPHHPLHLLRLVARPGAASAIAWAGEGLILTFLVVHLEGRGIPAGGLTGAASVFTVFAVSVIGARIASANLVDRVGAVRTAAVALVTVGAGLGTLAVAGSFAVAALGGVLLGFGFAPLFPALALLATERLRPEERGSGVGIFSAFMDAGIAAGSVLGGVMVATIGSGAAIGVVAVSQLGALALVLGTSPHRSSSPAGLETSIVATEASETPPL
jgi:predicted MFS family arabinose efflux permease